MQFLEIEEIDAEQADSFAIWQTRGTVILCRSNNSFRVNCCYHSEKDADPLHHLWTEGGRLP